MYDNETGLNVIADKNVGCEVNVVYGRADDGLVKAETRLKNKEYKVKIVHFVDV
jgi:hypothetical protein